MPLLVLYYRATTLGLIVTNTNRNRYDGGLGRHLEACSNGKEPSWKGGGANNPYRFESCRFRWRTI